MYFPIILGYFCLMNFLGFLSMGIDKKKAIKGAYRIPEKRLFAYALLFGSFGSILGMQIFRHKTKHWYFTLFMPLIFLLQILILYLCFYYI